MKRNNVEPDVNTYRSILQVSINIVSVVHSISYVKRRRAIRVLMLLQLI